MGVRASGPITSWQIDGETVETVADFIFLLGREDPLEEKMASHSGTLAMENPMDRKAWQAIQYMGVTKS